MSDHARDFGRHERARRQPPDRAAVLVGEVKAAPFFIVASARKTPMPRRVGRRLIFCNDAVV
jgi:hypothetical protein